MFQICSKLKMKVVYHITIRECFAGLSHIWLTDDAWWRLWICLLPSWIWILFSWSNLLTAHVGQIKIIVRYSRPEGTLYGIVFKHWWPAQKVTLSLCLYIQKNICSVIESKCHLIRISGRNILRCHGRHPQSFGD